MSNDSLPATVYPMVDYDDPNRMVTIQMKASDVWRIRKICACLTNQATTTHDILLSVANDSTCQDMDNIHRVLYFAEMGWQLTQVSNI